MWGLLIQLGDIPAPEPIPGEGFYPQAVLGNTIGAVMTCTMDCPTGATLGIEVY